MKLILLSSLVLSASFVGARFVEEQEWGQAIINISINELEPQYLIEFIDGKTEWVTDAEKWQLKLVSPYPRTKTITNTDRMANFSWI
jgi:hypothetical protein